MSVALVAVAVDGGQAAARRGRPVDTMHEGRLRRLRHAGFIAEQAQTISDFHTPNFM